MPLPVKLGDVVDHMDMCSEEDTDYLNRLTGEIVHVPEEYRGDTEDDEELDDVPDWQKEETAKIKEALESEDYVALPGKFEIHEWSIMDDFARSVEDEAASEQLQTVLRGRGAFRYFKDTIHRLGIQSDWYHFRDEAFKEIAREWLRENDIPFVEEADDA